MREMTVVERFPRSHLFLTISGRIKTNITSTFYSKYPGCYFVTLTTPDLFSLRDDHAQDITNVKRVNQMYDGREH